jgi:hypothetical protein
MRAVVVEDEVKVGAMNFTGRLNGALKDSQLQSRTSILHLSFLSQPGHFLNLQK